MDDRSILDDNNPHSRRSVSQRSAHGTRGYHSDVVVRCLRVVVQMSRKDGLHTGFPEQFEISPAFFRRNGRIAVRFVDLPEKERVVCEDKRCPAGPFLFERTGQPPELILFFRGVPGFVFQVIRVDAGQ